MLINQKMKDLALPILKEKVFMHDYVIYILSEIFGVRIYINEALMKYRIHECNQVGVTKKNIYNRIKNIKILDYKKIKTIKIIKKIYSKDITEGKMEKINIFLDIVENKNQFLGSMNNVLNAKIKLYDKLKLILKIILVNYIKK